MGFLSSQVKYTFLIIRRRGRHASCMKNAYHFPLPRPRRPVNTLACYILRAELPLYPFAPRLLFLRLQGSMEIEQPVMPQSNMIYFDIDYGISLTFGHFHYWPKWSWPMNTQRISAVKFSFYTGNTQMPLILLASRFEMLGISPLQLLVSVILVFIFDFSADILYTATDRWSRTAALDIGYIDASLCFWDMLEASFTS